MRSTATIIMAAGLGLAGLASADEPVCIAPNPVHPIWFDMAGEIQAGMTEHWREGDIVVSVPGKSGTTWTMNIVHQLRTKDGDEKMEDLYEHVHWLELYDKPNRTKEELYEMWDRDPHWFPRAFKTHEAPGKLPFDDKVKYVVVVRDPRDALLSFVPFMHAHTDHAIETWNLPPPLVAMMRPEGVADVFNGFAAGGYAFTNFVKNWWPHKDKKNVLMLHYSDMKKDHSGSVKKIHDFMGMKLNGKQLKNINRLTSFKHMKSIGDVFTVPNLLPGCIKPDGMVRNGKVGEHEKELPDEIRDLFTALVEKELTEEQANWMYNGGKSF